MIDLGTCKTPADAYFLDDTPSVLSLGKRCMDEGYSFIWPSGRSPVLVDDKGQRIDLTPHDNIPCVNLGTEECEPHTDNEASRIHSLLVKKYDVGDNHPVVYIDSSTGDEADPVEVGNRMKKSKTKKKKKKSRKAKVAAGEHYYNPENIWDDDDVPPDEGDRVEDVEEVPEVRDDDDEGDDRDDGEHDDDTLEVDVVDGDTRLAKRGTLKSDVLPPEEESYERYKEGTPNDGKIYLNDIGELVKIDKKGRPYKIGKDGRKTLRESPRPVDKYTPEEWQRLPIADRKVIKKMQQRERDRELAKSKAAR
eukprot:s114_g21.t1